MALVLEEVEHLTEEFQALEELLNLVKEKEKMIELTMMAKELLRELGWNNKSYGILCIVNVFG